jgi:hypothetical protein
MFVPCMSCHAVSLHPVNAVLPLPDQKGLLPVMHSVTFSYGCAVVPCICLQHAVLGMCHSGIHTSHCWRHTRGDVVAAR